MQWLHEFKLPKPLLYKKCDVIHASILAFLLYILPVLFLGSIFFMNGSYKSRRRRHIWKIYINTDNLILSKMIPWESQVFRSMEFSTNDKF